MKRHVAVVWVVVLGVTQASAAAPPAVTGRDLYGDPLPAGAVARFGTVRWEHARGEMVIVSPDGKTIFSAGSNGARAWDVVTGARQAWAEKLWGGWIKAARLLPDGKTLVTVSAESDPNGGLRWSVERWRWGTGEALGKLVVTSKIDPRDVYSGRRPILSHDGRVLLTTGAGRLGTLWNAETGEKLREIKDLEGATFTPDGKHVLFDSTRGGPHVREVATGKHVRQLAPDLSTETNVCDLSRDGNLVLASGGRWLYLFDLSTGKHVKREGKGSYWGARISPDGKWAVCATSKSFQLFDTKKLEVIREWPHAYRHDARVASFTPDGKKVVVTIRHVFRLLDVATGKITPSDVGHFGYVKSLAFSRDGGQLATCADNYGATVSVWDVATSRQMHTFSGHFRLAEKVTFSPDGKTLALGQTGDGSEEFDVCLFDLRKGKLLRQFPAHVRGVESLLFSPDGKRLATIGQDERLRLWDVATGRRLGEAGDVSRGTLVAFAGEEKSLLVSHWSDGQFAAFNLETLRRTSCFAVPGIRRAVYLPKQRQAVTVGTVVRETEVTWWALSGKKLRSLPLPISDTDSISLAPDASMLASGSRPITLWDLETGKSFATLDVDSSYGAYAFSPDGRGFATSGGTAALLWDVEHLRLQHLVREVLAGRGEARKLATAPDWVFARLSARLREVGEAEQRIVSLIADLDDDDFDKREDATQALENLGGKAAFALQRATESDSLEVRRRVKKLLERLPVSRETDETITPTKIEQAVRLLAKVETPAARQALAELAKLPPTTLVGKEARAAVQRFGKDRSKR